MNPQASSPSPADDQPVSEVARRVGPPLAIGSVVLMAALLAWIALAPTAIAGPLSEAPFTVPATLVTPPDDDGCLRVVDGDGTAREHCLDELALDDDAPYHYRDARFDEQGRLVVVEEDGDGRRLLHVDEVTGEVVETLDDTTFPDAPGEPRPAPEEAPIEPDVDEPPPGRDPPEDFVYTDGDRVLRADDGRWDPDDSEVLLDLQAPPGYRLDQAVLSPDGDWIVVLTGRGEIAVAPADGSAAPYVWTEVDDRWVDLYGAIRWDG